MSTQKIDSLHRRVANEIFDSINTELNNLHDKLKSMQTRDARIRKMLESMQLRLKHDLEFADSIAPDPIIEKKAVKSKKSVEWSSNIFSIIWLIVVVCLAKTLFWK